MKEDMLDLYSDFLIAQNKYATATGFAALYDGGISHDKVTRFLNKSKFDSKDLWEYIKPEVRKVETADEGVLIIDDSIEEKPYTDENEIVNWHYSHAKGMCLKGINIMSCLVRYGDISFPVGYQEIHKDIAFCDVLTKKIKRKSSKSKNQLFRELIQRSIINKIKWEYILSDNWFGSNENLSYIHYEINRKFIIGAKSNRVIAMTADDKKNGQYEKLSSLNLKDGEKRIVFLKDLSFPVALITKIFKNEDGSEGTLYLVTNDLESSADQIYDVYKKRWRIEEYHKSIKQNASLEKSPTKVVRSQKTHIFASIIAFCKLELLKIKTSLGHFALKYKLLVKANRLMYRELQELQSS